jgi:hypothetical protein
MWYVPQFKTTRLLSVRTLTQAGYHITFEENDKAYCRCPKSNTLIFEAKYNLGLYKLCDIPEAYKAKDLPSLAQLNNDTGLLRETEAELWYRRLAHTNYEDIRKLQSASIGIKLKRRLVIIGKRACEGYLAGKMKERLSKSTTSCSNKAEAKLHTDMSGRIGISIRGYRYFLLVCNDVSRYTWIRLLKTVQTEEVLPQLQNILSWVERYTGNKVTAVRADNGKGEFSIHFQNHLTSQGIVFEPYPPYNHAMNGVAERAIYTTDCKTRSLLFEGSLSGEFWCYAMEHAVYIKNKVPTSALPFGDLLPSNAITPWHAYTGQLPQFEKLVTFGCHANPLNTLEKHPPKMPFCHKPDYVFMGMEGNKIWKLMNLHTHQIERYGDAEFNEYKFPLKGYKPTIGTGAPPRARKGGEKKADSTSTLVRGTQALEHQVCRARTDGEESRTLYKGEASDGLAGTSLQLEGSGTGHSMSDRDSASSRVVGKSHKVFSDTTVQLIVSLKAVHITDEDTISLGVPTAPFEAIDFDAAMQEDAPGWRRSIIEEDEGLLKNKAFTIRQGTVPMGRKLILNRLVLRKKYNTHGEVIRLKS